MPRVAVPPASYSAMVKSRHLAGFAAAVLTATSMGAPLTAANATPSPTDQQLQEALPSTADYLRAGFPTPTKVEQLEPPPSRSSHVSICDKHGRRILDLQIPKSVRVRLPIDAGQAATLSSKRGGTRLSVTWLTRYSTTVNARRSVRTIRHRALQCSPVINSLNKDGPTIHKRQRVQRLPRGGTAITTRYDASSPVLTYLAFRRTNNVIATTYYVDFLPRNRQPASIKPARKLSKITAKNLAHITTP